jgi:hypothetical protein
MRSGGATAAANSDINDRVWKRHGRWKSDSSKDGYVVDSVDMNFDMYTMERRLEMTLPVQTNLNTSIGSTRLVTFTEHTVNTYIFPLLLPNRGKIVSKKTLVCSFLLHRFLLYLKVFYRTRRASRQNIILMLVLFHTSVWTMKASLNQGF